MGGGSPYVIPTTNGRRNLYHVIPSDRGFYCGLRSSRGAKRRSSEVEKSPYNNVTLRQAQGDGIKSPLCPPLCRLAQGFLMICEIRGKKAFSLRSASWENVINTRSCVPSILPHASVSKHPFFNEVVSS